MRIGGKKSNSADLSVGGMFCKAVVMKRMKDDTGLNKHITEQSGTPKALSKEFGNFI